MTAVQQALGRPRPLADEVSRPYWEALREHRFSLPFCSQCEVWCHPATLLCPSGHEVTDVREVSGRASLYSYTTVREATTIGLDPPYVVALVAIDEQPDVILITNLLGLDGAEPVVGMPLEVVYEDVAPDATLALFRPAQGGG